jgi:hypothetical protein
MPPKVAGKQSAVQARISRQITPSLRERQSPPGEHLAARLLWTTESPGCYERRAG